MARPWDVTSDDIEQWSRRVDAPGVLPDLVRRLLLSTMPLSRISMSAHAGTRLSGLDGVVNALDESPFCPQGPSVWELSVEGDVRKKLDPDFRKRSDKHGADEASRTTYVAVSARRVPSRERWEAERQAERVWRSVWLLDAEHLAAWLATAPAVGRWFAAKVGHPAADAEDLEELLDRWSRRTRVRLPVEIALAGQDRQRLAEGVRAFARSVGRRRDAAPLRVHAESWEEAVIFAAAALQTDPSAEGEQVRARTIVARDAEMVRTALHAQAAQPLVVIAAYAGAEAEVGPVVVPLEGAIPAGAHDVMEVKPAPYLRFVEILERAGTPKPEAERVAKASGGSLAALQQVLGYVARPRWVDGLAPVPLAALLLAGAFEPGNEEDRTVLALLGADAGEVEQLCERLRLAPEAPTIKEMARSHRPVWQWRPEGAAWKALAGQIPAKVLGQFAQTIVLVLEERPPAREEVWAAALQGKSLRPSGSLRGGLTRSLVWLAASDDALEKLHGRGQGSALAASVVRALLPLGWEPWASLSGLLPLLAEAAPEAFLDHVEASLLHGHAGVAHLLAEEKPMGGAPHTGLLWALETLGWDAALMPRVASALARLAEADAKLPEKRGTLSNRPARSLKGLLRMTWPQTAASAEQRIAEVKRRLIETPRVGFDFLVGEIAGVGDMVMLDPSHEPEIRPLPVLDRDAQNERRQGEGCIPRSYLDVALEHAGQDTERWAGLLERIRPDPYLAGLLLDRIETIKDGVDDKDALLWSAIRHCISRVVATDDEARPEPHEADEPTEKEINERLQRLYVSFCPADLTLRYAWLFLPNAELPRPFDPKRDYEDNYAELQRLQVQAVGDIGWNLPVLSALAERVASTSNLGWVLGQAPFVDELDHLLLDAPPPSCFVPQVPTYFFARSNARGIEWVHDRLRSLFDQGRRDELGACLEGLPHSAMTWDFVEALGNDVAQAYWRRLSYLQPNASTEDRERAVLRLVEVGNLATAMSAARREKGEVSDQLIATVLSALLTARPDEMRRTPRDGLMSYTLGKLMDQLESAQGVEEKYAVLLGNAELVRALITFDSKRPMKRLSALFARQSTEFVTLVERMYRPTGEPPPERTPEEQAEARQLAEGAYRILEAWKGWPGQGMLGPAEQSTLYEWALQVLRTLAAGGRPDTGAVAVACVLARPDKGADGHWPCLAARQILELEEFPGLAAALRIAKWNLRGMHGRALGEGGKQERAIAATHREAARALRPGYPRTADMLDALAAEYEQDAVREDEHAEATLRQYGAEPHDLDGRPAPAPALPPPPSAPPPSPSPQRRVSAPAQPEVLVARLAAAIGDEAKEEIATAGEQLREQGRQQVLEGSRAMLLDLLCERFGTLPDTAIARVTAADFAQLREWSRRVIKAPTLDDVLGR